MRAIRAAVVSAAAGALVWAGSFDTHVFASKKTCELAGVSVMSFGTYDPLSNAVLDANGSVSYRCYNALTFDSVPDTRKLTVQISISTGSAGTFQRRMNGGRDVLHYNLYTDASRSIVWGDGTSGTSIVSEHAQPNNHVETIPVFGRVLAGQDIVAGQYLDNVLVTLNY